MKCNNCGKEIKEKSLFCSNCGTIVGSSVKITKTKKSKSQYVLIALALLLLIFTVACYIVFKNSGQIVDMNGIKIYVPNDYKEEIKAGYDEAYISPKEDIVIGIITKENKNLKLDDYIKNLDLKSSDIKCEKEFTKNINNTKWTKYKCKSEKEKTNMYITLTNKKIYIVFLETIKEKNISNLEDKIESSLELIK